ncbi:exodeoxyribonuclease VII large subunit [Candidatus Omnitrophota bacterium]
MKRTKHIYTVSEITRDIKLILDNTFADIWVEGEISGVSRIPSGTVFFSLKDKESLLKCVIFAAAASRIKFQMKEGLQMICSGRISVYEKQGNYQFYAETLEPKGIGSLQLALEQLKQKLEKEGLFSLKHKRPISYLPSRIGVVTSQRGAALKDILNVLDRRFAQVHVILAPARVQGEGAREEIASAIHDLNRLNQGLPVKERIEVMIVGRGGGSIEDLWAFNEEVVARAIYDSAIPVISSVGHERDWTIADLVSDLRAPTPSAAAELVIPRKEELKAKLSDLSRMLKRSCLDLAGRLQERLAHLTHRLNLGNPALLLQQHQRQIADLARQIYVRASHLVRLKSTQLANCAGKLASLSPLNILSRGYSITFMPLKDIALKDTSLLKMGDTVKTRLHRGEFLSRVTAVQPKRILRED